MVLSGSTIGSLSWFPFFNRGYYLLFLSRLLRALELDVVNLIWSEFCWFEKLEERFGSLRTLLK